MRPGNTGSRMWVCIRKASWREGHLATAELLSRVAPATSVQLQPVSCPFLPISSLPIRFLGLSLLAAHPRLPPTVSPQPAHQEKGDFI